MQNLLSNVGLCTQEVSPSKVIGYLYLTCLGTATCIAALELPLSVSAQSHSYGDWAQAEAIPVDQRGEADTPAGDSVPNMIKFATGLKAMETANPAELLDYQVNPQARSIDLNFKRSVEAGNVLLVPEWSWTVAEGWQTGYYGMEQSGIEEGREVWNASIPMGQEGFFRLRAGEPDADFRPRYRSPFDMAYSADGSLLAISDREYGLAYIIEMTGPEAGTLHTVILHGEPTGLVWGPGKRLLVSEYGVGTIAEIDAVADVPHVVRRMQIGAMPYGLAYASSRQLLVMAEFGRSEIRLIDYSSGTVNAILDAPRNPGFVAVTPDETLALVAGTLPSGSSDMIAPAARVALVDLTTRQIAAEISLPNGSTNVRQVKVSPNGRWAYLVHNIGAPMLPAIKLDRGWVNTNALTIIDLATRQRYATLLLDETIEGVTDPWGIALGDGGDTLWISISGVHQIARVNLKGLHGHLAGDSATKSASTAMNGSIWRNIWAGKESIEYDLHFHFTALTGPKLITRARLPLNGPRALAISPIDGSIAVAGYFSGNLMMLDPVTLETLADVPLGNNPEPDAYRRGQIYFHDATLSTQYWVSCATCHPDGRADGLNWDLPNDKLGTYKNTKSLVGAHANPPTTWTGIRPNATVSVAAGFDHIHFTAVPQHIVEDTNTYVQALKPEPSPYRVNGRLTPLAETGKAIFENPSVGCIHCHSGPWFSNNKLYDVGTLVASDGNVLFDTPMTVEMWRTGPFLHDGRASSVMDVIEAHNLGDGHGVTSHLTAAEKAALVEYLLSF